MLIFRLQHDNIFMRQIEFENSTAAAGLCPSLTFDWNVFHINLPKAKASRAQCEPAQGLCRG